MAVLDKLRQRMANWAVGWTGSSDFATHLRGLPTEAGPVIDTDNALALSTVYACVQRIASTCAQMQLGIVRKEADGDLVIDDSHPAHLLISERPADDLTAYEFWETIVTMMLIYGKGYAKIHRDRAGRPLALELINPKRVRVKLVADRTMYEIESDGVYFQTDMLCIHAMYRVSPIELHRETLGLAKAAQQFAAEFFGNSGNMTGVLTPEQPMRKEQLDIVENSWNNSGKKLGTKVLPFGFKYSRMGVDPQAAQMKEQRDFQNQEICRIFGVPPSLVGVQSNTTYSNTEQQAIQFAKYTIAPLTRRIEQEINAKLVYEEDRGQYMARYDMSDLLRGDTAARAAYYTQALNVGWMNRDEVRRAEGLNRIGEGGDVFTVQVNQIALSKLDEYSAKISSDEKQG